MHIVRSTIGALALSCVSLAGMSPAAAEWGCFAHGRGTSQGWSYNYESIRQARRWALHDCELRPHSGACRILRCSPYANTDAYWRQGQ